MADFRKWLLAFAVVALLLGTGISAQAQQNGIGNGGGMTCTAASTPVLDRSEGYTELTGDILLSCVGGTPTSTGVLIGLSNVRVGLNTNITSRINPADGDAPNPAAGGPPSEALLLLDNAYFSPSNPPSTPQAGAPPFRLCPNLTGCDAYGPGFTGVSPYLASNVGAATPSGAYSAYEGVYVANPATTPGVGAISGYNAIDFLGVPIDAPGTNLTRVIRITNIRADAVSRAGGAAGIVGSIPIVAFVSIGGALSGVSITNSQPTVAYVVPGLVITTTSATFPQCVSPSGGPSVTVAEGFSYAFKPRIFSSTSGSGLVDDTTGTPEAQNLAGYSYFSESGFTPTGVSTTSGTTSVVSGDIGVADSGTRFIIRFSNLQNGVTVSVPDVITGTGSLELALVPGADAYGAGGVPVTVSTSGTATLSVVGTYAGGTTASTGFAVYEVVRANGNENENFTVPFSVSFTPAVASNIPYVTPQGITDLLTPTGGFSQASIWFAPSAVASVAIPTGSNAGLAWNIGQGPYTGGDYQWIPRFADESTLTNIIGVLPCTCNLLYPYVTSATGYDTGIAISNTSMDPFAGFATPVATPAPLSGVCGDCVSPSATATSVNTGQVGGVTFWFFGNTTNTSATNPTLFRVPEATSTSVLIVPPGCTLAFEMTQSAQAPTSTLAGCGTAQTATGGLAATNYTINATAVTTPLMGFTGYAIATASFQYCHGLAYILPTATGAPLGGMYLAIELDTPFWASGIPGFHNPVTQRTGQYGESQGQ